MVNRIEVADANPIAFVKEVEKQIQNGFYVTTDIAGYPILGFPMIVALTESDVEPELKNKLDDEVHTVVIEGWNILTFLLDVQNVVLQGFELDTERAVFGDFKSMIFNRRKAVKVDLKPTPKAAEADEGEAKPARKPRAKANKE